MYDERSTYSIGIRDVIAAWLFCLAVVGVFLISAPVTTGMAGPAIHADAVSMPPTPIFFCRS